jgi:membrane protein DedA with SNARE-associated domain
MQDTLSFPVIAWTWGYAVLVAFSCQTRVQVQIVIEGEVLAVVIGLACWSTPMNIYLHRTMLLARLKVAES